MQHLYAQKHVFNIHIKKLSFVVALGFAGLVSTTSSWADAKLSVPETMVIQSIDGQEAGNLGSFARKHRIYTLSKGEHVITARYDQLFRMNNYDGDDIVKSNGVTIKATLTDNQSYKLGWSKEPETLDEAKAFVKRPTLVLQTDSGVVITEQKGAITPDVNHHFTATNNTAQTTSD